MKKGLIHAITFSFVILGCLPTSLAQQGAVAPSVLSDERTTREQDGLEGPVRRVRVETAKMMVKAGKIVEGPRAVRGIATYDSMGKKIDSVDYPVESSTVPGKERYRYDDKGNIIEMVVLGPDGSVLSKEAYDYEFDPVGNWTKMNTSVAVYENGKVTFEPTEVTYRTISYYYNQAIEKLGNATAKSKPATAPAPQNTEPAAGTRLTAKSVAANHPVADKVAAEIKETTTNPNPPAPTAVRKAETAGNVLVAKNEPNTEAVTPPKTTVLKLDEEALRRAALEVPTPEYPQAALLSRTGGKVEVQILVNEKGVVTNARAQGGNPLLAQAAEDAALKARFSPNKISSDAAIAFGVLTYTFTPPPLPSTVTASNTVTDTKPSTPVEKKVPPPQTEEKTAAATKPVAFTETRTKSDAAAEESNYSKGMTFLAAGHYDEAAALFNQVVQADPNDANAYAKLATSYSGMNKNKEAIAGYKMATQINRAALDANAYFYWGKSYLALEKNSDAISAFKQALSMMRAEAIGLEAKETVMPTPEQIHHYLGTAYINSKKFKDSIKEFKQVVALNPANAEAYYALAISYINTGDAEAAAEANKILAGLDLELSQKITAAISNNSTFGCRNVACRR